MGPRPGTRGKEEDMDAEFTAYRDAVRQGWMDHAGPVTKETRPALRS